MSERDSMAGAETMMAPRLKACNPTPLSQAVEMGRFAAKDPSYSPRQMTSRHSRYRTKLVQASDVTLPSYSDDLPRMVQNVSSQENEKKNYETEEISHQK